MTQRDGPPSLLRRGTACALLLAIVASVCGAYVLGAAEAEGNTPTFGVQSLAGALAWSIIAAAYLGAHLGISALRTPRVDAVASIVIALGGIIAFSFTLVAGAPALRGKSVFEALRVLVMATAALLLARATYTLAYARELRRAVPRARPSSPPPPPPQREDYIPQTTTRAALGAPYPALARINMDALPGFRVNTLSPATTNDTHVSPHSAVTPSPATSTRSTRL